MEDVQFAVRPKVFVGRVPPWLCPGLKLASLMSTEDAFYSDEQRRKPLISKGNTAAPTGMNITVGVGPPKCILRAVSSKPLKITVGRKPPSKGQIGCSASGSVSDNTPKNGLTKARSLVKSGSLKTGVLHASSTNETKASTGKKTLDVVDGASNKLMSLLSSESIVAFHADRVELENEKRRSLKSKKRHHISDRSKAGNNDALSKGISWSSDLCVVYPSDDSISRHIPSKSAEGDVLEDKTTSEKADVNSQRAVVDECKVKLVQGDESRCSASIPVRDGDDDNPPKEAKEAIASEKEVTRPDSIEQITEVNANEKGDVMNDTIEGNVDCGVIQRADSNRRQEKLNRIKNRLSTIIRMGNMNDDEEEEEEATIPTDAYGYGLEHSQSSASDIWSNKDTDSQSYDKLSHEPSKIVDAHVSRPARSYDISRSANIRMNVIANKYNRIKDELEKLGSQHVVTDVKGRYEHYEKKIPPLWYKEAKLSISRKNDVEFKAENFPSLHKLFNKYRPGMSQDII